MIKNFRDSFEKKFEKTIRKNVITWASTYNPSLLYTLLGAIEKLFKGFESPSLEYLLRHILFNNL